MNCNSIFIMFVQRCFLTLKKSYHQSVTCRIFQRIYAFFSSAWRNSFILTRLSKACAGGVGKVWNITAFFFSIPQKISSFFRLEHLVRESKILQEIHSFSANILALNTQILSALLFGFGVGGACGDMLVRHDFSLFLLIPLFFGILFRCFRIDLTAVITESKLVSLFEYSFGITIPCPKHISENGRLFAVLLGLLCGAVSSFRILIGIALMIAAIGALLVLYRPFIGVVCCVIFAPFVPTMALVGLLGLTFASLILYSMIHSDFHYRLDWVGVLILLFVAVTGLSVVTSYHRMNSAMVCGVTVLFMMIYFCVINTATDKNSLSLLLKLFVISGCLVAGYGILQYLFGWGADVRNAWLDEEMFEDTKFRVYSTLENPNVLGEYLLLVGFVAGGLLCSVKKYWQKFVYFGMTAVIFLCLILTQSRGCWLGFMVGLAMYITSFNGKFWGFLPFMLVAFPFVIPQSILNRFASIGNLNDSSSSYRVFIWLGTLNMLRDFWLSGVGMGEEAFNNIYPLYSYNAIIAPHSHNLYLQIIVHSGIPALAIFIAMMWISVRYSVSVYRSCGKRSEWGILSVAIGCGILAFLFQGIFDYVFYNYRVMMLFWSVIGIASALWHTGKEEAYD